MTPWDRVVVEALVAFRHEGVTDLARGWAVRALLSYATQPCARMGGENVGPSNYRSQCYYEPYGPDTKRCASCRAVEELMTE